MTYRLPVEIEWLDEGVYLADCPMIPGCHAEGKTIGEALDNLRSVAQALYELCQEKGLPFIPDLPGVSIEEVMWQVEFPLAVVQ